MFTRVLMTVFLAFLAVNYLISPVAPILLGISALAAGIAWALGK